MHKKSHSGITVNGIPLEAKIQEEEQEPSQMTLDEFKKKHDVYHRPRLCKKSDNGERPGPVMRNIKEINKRKDETRFFYAFREQNIKKAIVSHLVSHTMPLTADQISEALTQKLENLGPDLKFMEAPELKKTLSPHAIRAHMNSIARSELALYMDITKDPTSNKILYFVKDTEMTFKEALRLSTNIVEPRKYSHRKQPVEQPEAAITKEPEKPSEPVEETETETETEIDISLAIPGKNLDININGKVQIEFIFKIG